VVAVGYNRGRTHAEVQALSKLWPSKRAGVRLYSIRVTPGGRLAMARPCALCQAYMRDAGVKDVYYTTATGDLERMRL
jgi:cytidine deaminase